jgi:outer membrane protein W
MRRALLFLAVCLITLPLAAQQSPDKPLRVSLLATDITYTESDSTGSNLDTGFSIGLQYQFTPRWSAEASYGREEHTASWATYHGPTFVEVERRTVTSQPFEFTGQFNFANDSRWKPYIGAGARYISKPDDGTPRSETQLAPLVTAGVHFQITPTFSLRAEGKGKIGDDRYYDSQIKTAIGIGWRF